MRSAFSPLWLGKVGSPYTTDFAASSACLNASGVERSGSGAPARTATPMPVLASGTRLSGFTTPSLSSRSMAGSETITASNISPSLIFCLTTTGEPKVRTTWWPLSAPKSAASALTAFCTAPTLSTRMSAAPAMPVSEISVTATQAFRPKVRIVSSPRKCQMSAILRLAASILHHAPRRIARARFAPYRHRADVRGGGVLCHARHHREISQSLHEHAAGGVGALYRRVPVPVHRVESVDPPRSDPHQSAGAADRAFGAASGIDALQFSGAEIPSARRGDRARVLHAVLRCGALGPDAGGVGTLAALDRDRGGLRRRAGGDPSGRGKLPAGGAAVAYRSALLRALFHHHPHSRPHRFQRDHPVLFEHRGCAGLASGRALRMDDAERPPRHRAHGGDRRDGELRSLSPDRGAPAGAGRGFVAVPLYRDRIGDRLGLPRVRRRAQPVHAHGRRHRGRLRPLHAPPRADGEGNQGSGLGGQ